MRVPSDSSHLRERDKALLRSIMVEGVWNGLLLGWVRSQVIPCRFCVAPDGDGHLFWECTFPPLVEIREHPEFHDLMEMDKTSWPRCLLWHGWLPLFSGINGGSEFHDLMSVDKGIGLDACFGMVGFPCSLVLMVPPLGQLVHLRVTVTLLKLRLEVTLLV